VIIGGGAAVLSAALFLGRARRTVAVIDAGAPRNAPAAHMQGFLSRDGMPPAELLKLGREEVTGYGAEVIDDTVTHIEGGFIVSLASGETLHARRILLTTGARDDLPDIPGVRDRWGRDLLHCPYCHGWEIRDQPLGVLNTHTGAVAHAQLIRQWSDDVIFFAHTDDVAVTERAALAARGIRIIDGAVVALVVENDRLAGVELDDGTVVPRSAVFVRPRSIPHADGLLAALAVDVGADGFALVDRDGHTSTSGVYAAGNIVDPRASVIAAAGAAATAAMAINADLVQEDAQSAAASRTTRPTKTKVHLSGLGLRYSDDRGAGI
jgi:thioredoxin reductase